MQILSKEGSYRHLRNSIWIFIPIPRLFIKSRSQKILPSIPPSSFVEKSMFIQITSRNDVWTPKAEQQPTRRQTISGRLKTETSPGGSWQRHDRCLWGITLLYVSLLLHLVLIRSQPLWNLNTRKYWEKIAERFSPWKTGSCRQEIPVNINFVLGENLLFPPSRFISYQAIPGCPE